MALEEYLTVRNILPEWSFVGVLRQRVQPFVADLTHRPSRPIDAANIPKDVKWKQESHSKLRIGHSATRPNVVFFRDDNRTYFQTIDNSRKSIVSLVVLFLGKELGVSDVYRDYIDRSCDPKADHAAAEAEYEAKVAVQGADYTDLDGANDSPEMIEAMLIKLAGFSECTSVFNLGRKIGRLAGTITCFEAGMPAADVGAQLFRVIPYLWSVENVQASTTASSALKRLGRVFEPELKHTPLWQAADMFSSKGVDFPKSKEELEHLLAKSQDLSQQAGEGSPDPHHERIGRARDGWMLVWVLVGDQLSFMREHDESFIRIDASLPSPRGFQIQRDDSPDKVLDLITCAERDLNSPADIPRSPELIIGYLIHGIEPLVTQTERFLCRDLEFVEECSELCSSVPVFDPLEEVSRLFTADGIA